MPTNFNDPVDIIRNNLITFDAGSDIVFTDTELVNDSCLSITNFRRQLMANTLGIKPRPMILEQCHIQTL
jgi:hypothetical protein